MSFSTKTLSLIEQKRLQWAKEKEEIVGLCGLWGRPKYKTEILSKCEEGKLEVIPPKRSSILPPIPCISETDGIQKGDRIFRTEEESETSGYTSDSPKHINEEMTMDTHFKDSSNSNGEWYGGADSKSYEYKSVNSPSQSAMDEKLYKNYKNEKWAQSSSEAWRNQQNLRNAKNWWFGTPESVSSDDGNRLKWGDRGVGIGHLWEPVIHQPDSRLPQLESYRPTPKWVERGLRQGEGTQNADILIIHHPDDEQYKNYSSDGQTSKNFILGQNVHLTPDVLEERERKRRRALEHQNAIRQQLEDRERKRREERQNKLREERLEEERIKREQETERQRLEEELKKSKEKEEKEKRKEEVMKEAIARAERKAKEEKRYQRKHCQPEPEQNDEISRAMESQPDSSRSKKSSLRTPRIRTVEDNVDGRTKTSRNENSNRDRPGGITARAKTLKNSSSQFEDLRLSNGAQFLNMNHLPMDGGLTLVLDNPPPDNNFLLPSESVQLALLMSPGNVSSGQIIPIQTSMSASLTPLGRVLTPSKFRQASSQRDQSIQTDGACCSAFTKSCRVFPRSRKQCRRSGRVSGFSDSSEKSNSLERPRAHRDLTSKHRSLSQPKYSIEDRPKWGINRPSVQYKKQSEKDIYYQKRIRQRLKKTTDIGTSTGISPKSNENPSKGVEEKLLESEMRLLKCDTDDDESSKLKEMSPDALPDEIPPLRNGYRMSSNPSSPLFVPIDTERTTTEKSEQGEEFVLELIVEPLQEECKKIAAEDEQFSDTPVHGSVGYVTQSQLDAIKQIASLKEGLQKLQNDFSSSRSITPYSDKNE